jgi:tetratricopeptide (TPR) repeat protein
MRASLTAQRFTPLYFSLFLMLFIGVRVGCTQDVKPQRAISLVEPLGPGRIVISFGQGWQLKAAYLKGNVDQYIGTGWWLSQKTKNPSIKDDGLAPEIELINPVTDLDVTFSLFPNPIYSRYPAAPRSKLPEDCRDNDSSLFVILSGQSFGSAQEVFEKVKVDSKTAPSGRPMATASFLYRSKGSSSPEKRLFGFNLADPLCAKIQIVKPSYQQGDEPVLKAALDAFVFEPDYTPTSTDYSTLGALLYKFMKSYASAAVYYQRALDTLPSDAPLQIRRVLVDQLSMSYGISGQLKHSRAVNEAAIQTDPDYPLYYYNLACADAEQGKAADAKLHLQQAFDRKANTLPGEHLPDPTKDDSILKLKKDKSFWTFVESLQNN